MSLLHVTGLPVPIVYQSLLSIQAVSRTFSQTGLCKDELQGPPVHQSDGEERKETALSDDILALSYHRNGGLIRSH